MSSQLFKGSEIIALAKKDKPQKIVNTQTAKQAASTIRRKYGSISESAKYYHRGAGDWVKYDPSKDMKSTSRKVLTKMPRNYAKVAHQVDVRGVDTKRAGKGAMSTRKSGRSPKENMVDKLKKIGGKEWISGTNHRIYFNNLSKYYNGLSVSRYGTGNISSATLNGEKLSNSRARALMTELDMGKLWYDVKTGQFESQRMSSEVKNKVVAGIKNRL